MPPVLGGLKLFKDRLSEPWKRGKVAVWGCNYACHANELELSSGGMFVFATFNLVLVQACTRMRSAMSAL